MLRKAKNTMYSKKHSKYDINEKNPSKVLHK